jgi:hypothetical protein
MTKIFLGLIPLITLLFGCSLEEPPSELIHPTPPPIVGQTVSTETQTERSMNFPAPLPTDKVVPKGNSVRKSPKIASKNGHINIFPATPSPVSRMPPQRRDDDDDNAEENEQPVVQNCEGISPDVSPSVLDFLGCETLQIIAKPDKVNSFLLESEPNETLPIANRLGAYPIQIDGQGLNLEGTNLIKFQEFVFSEESYHFGMEKRCRFEPNIGLHFTKGDKAVEVLFSVPCNLWLFVYGEEEKLEDFDPIQSQLNFLNSLFPIDTEEDSETS